MSFDSHLVVSRVVVTIIMSPGCGQAVAARQQIRTSTFL